MPENCIHCGEADWKGYDAAEEAGMPRQLARAKFGIMTNDALSQLSDHCFIFHWLVAWDALKGGLKQFLTLRCNGCGGRHWRRLRNPVAMTMLNPYGYRYCGYGYRSTLMWWWRTWWYAGRHGVD